MQCQASRSLLGEAGQTGTQDSCDTVFFVLLPDGAQLGDDEGNSEGGNGGQEQGAWECAEVGNPEGA